MNPVGDPAPCDGGSSIWDPSVGNPGCDGGCSTWYSWAGGGFTTDIQWLQSNGSVDGFFAGFGGESVNFKSSSEPISVHGRFRLAGFSCGACVTTGIKSSTEPSSGCVDGFWFAGFGGPSVNIKPSSGPSSDDAGVYSSPGDLSPVFVNNHW